MDTGSNSNMSIVVEGNRNCALVKAVAILSHESTNPGSALSFNQSGGLACQTR
jgi:hypothetical protein